MNENIQNRYETSVGAVMWSAARQDRDQASGRLACLVRLRHLRIQLEKHVELEWTRASRKLEAAKCLPNSRQYRSAKTSNERRASRTTPESKGKRKRGGLLPNMNTGSPRRFLYFQKIKKIC